MDTIMTPSYHGELLTQQKKKTKFIYSSTVSFGN